MQRDHSARLALWFILTWMSLLTVIVILVGLILRVLPAIATLDEQNQQRDRRDNQGRTPTPAVVYEETPNG